MVILYPNRKSFPLKSFAVYDTPLLLQLKSDTKQQNWIDKDLPPALHTCNTNFQIQEYIIDINIMYSC